MPLILIAEINHTVYLAMEIECIYTDEQEDVESEKDVSPQSVIVK